MKKKSNILNAVAALSCVGLLAGGYFLVSNFSRLSKSILPGLHSSPSKSMKLYTIRLRAPDHWGETKERDKVHEWKLVLPRAFVYSEFGDPDDLKQGYTAKLRVVIDQRTEEITPAAISTRASYDEDGAIITLRNNGKHKKFYYSHNCLNYENLFRDVYKKTPFINAEKITNCVL